VGVTVDNFYTLPLRASRHEGRIDGARPDTAGKAFIKSVLY
jgi:hypothetical protein